MFQPSAKIQKLLASYDATAYIYRDGVAVIQKSQIKVKGGNPVDIQIVNAIPCEIPVKMRDGGKHSWDNKIEFRRLVVHDCRLIAGGFDEIEITLNSGSQNSDEKGLTINHIYFSKGYHRWHNLEIVNCLDSRITIQPNPYDRFSHYDSQVEDTLEKGLEFYRYKPSYSIVQHGEFLKAAA